jgi:hypothetical protein
MSEILKILKRQIEDKLEHPICTIDFRDYGYVSETEIEALKAWATEQGYIYSDGRLKGHFKLWVRKNT